MIVGWATKTSAGVTLYASQRGRFFRDVASARSRESVVYKATGRQRGCASRRRDHYLRHWEHLDWSAPRKVRTSGGEGPCAA